MASPMVSMVSALVDLSDRCSWRKARFRLVPVASASSDSACVEPRPNRGTTAGLAAKATPQAHGVHEGRERGWKRLGVVAMWRILVQHLHILLVCECHAGVPGSPWPFLT